MEKITVNILDFDLFIELVKATSKIVDSAKFEISENGLEIYGARNRTARCEFVSNTVYTEKPVSFSLENLNTFTKVLSTIKQVHDGDYSTFKFIIDLPHIRFESKKFKTKLGTQDEHVIANWTSKKIEIEMTSVFDFTTTSDYIRQLNNHSFMFNETSSTRIYLETKDDMEKNVIYATLGNRESELNNELTLKFGLVTKGSLNGRSVIIDFERLNLFNAIPSDNVKVSLMDKNCLVLKTKILGKKDSYFNFTLYNTILKS